MSEFAFFRFKSANMLTDDEERDREEIIRLTEQVLDLKGIECDAKIAKISEDQLREILEEVRRLRRKKKKTYVDSTDININEQDIDSENDEGESPYIR
jgi:ABC-type phosphate transport system auxiliary subunit